MKRIVRRIMDAEVSRKNLAFPFIPYYFHMVKKFIIRRYLINLQEKTVGITSVLIETYGFCNRSCSFCFNNEQFPKREQGIMDQRTFEKVIDDLAALKYYKRLSPHFYGEPLLDKRLPELIEYVRRKLPNCYISMSTNGDFLKREICEELIKRGVDRFIVTNYDDEEKSALNMLAAEFPYHIYLRNYKEIVLEDRAGEILKRNKSLKTPCLRPSAQLVINWKGDVVLCCQDYYGKYILGNVNDIHLMDIWNNKKFKILRDDLAQGKRSNVTICKFCDYHGGKPT